MSQGGSMKRHLRWSRGALDKQVPQVWWVKFCSKRPNYDDLRWSAFCFLNCRHAKKKALFTVWIKLFLLSKPMITKAFCICAPARFSYMGTWKYCQVIFIWIVQEAVLKMQHLSKCSWKLRVCEGRPLQSAKNCHLRPATEHFNLHEPTMLNCPTSQQMFTAYLVSPAKFSIHGNSHE